MQATLDPIVQDTTLWPGTSEQPANREPGTAVSFGFAQLEPVRRGKPEDRSGWTYDAALGLNFDANGNPIVFSPTMATKYKQDTWVDHQKWDDPGTD